MVKPVDHATVKIYGDKVGVVAWDRQRELGFFEFEPAFLQKGIKISPYIIRSNSPGVISYPNLNRNTYKRLPGFLADTLPDDFGNAVIDAWLAKTGRPKSSFSPVERLCYTGTRGMGALEFSPAIARKDTGVGSIEIAELVGLASKVLNDKEAFVSKTGRSDEENARALAEIISVGTSAGGQRPKALLAIHPKTGRIVSGQIKPPAGYEHWLLKFDGVSGGVAAGAGVVSDPQGFGKIEHAYYLMAKACGIDMNRCKLYEENDRFHFMTKRFDRTTSGKKIHMTTLCGLAHFDYNSPGYYSYEQLFSVMRELKLPHTQAVQMYRRMVFNIVARNQDDHTKNITFLMNPNGHWKLSPAYDLTFSYNPTGQWTNQHQMTVNGKRDNFTKTDLITVGKSIKIQKPKAIIEEITDTVSTFKNFAQTSGIENNQTQKVQLHHRLTLKS